MDPDELLSSPSYGFFFLPCILEFLVSCTVVGLFSGRGTRRIRLYCRPPREERLFYTSLSLERTFPGDLSFLQKSASTTSKEIWSSWRDWSPPYCEKPHRRWVPPSRPCARPAYLSSLLHSPLFWFPVPFRHPDEYAISVIPLFCRSRSRSGTFSFFRLFPQKSSLNTVLTAEECHRAALD